MRLLEKHYSKVPLAQFRSRHMPYRSAASIQERAAKLGLTKPSRAWSAEEDDLLRQHFGQVKTELIRTRHLPGRTLNGIYARAIRLGLSGTQDAWTPRELRALKKYYGKLPIKDLIERHIPGRTVKAIQARAEKLSLTRGVKPDWTAREDRVLEKHYGRRTPGEIQALYLPARSTIAIAKRAGALGLGESRADKWTAAEERILRRHYPALRTPVVQERYLPHRTVAAIRLRVRALGLRRILRDGTWSKAELALIRRDYQRPGGLERLATRLRCSQGTIRIKAGEMGLSLPRPNQWSAAEISALRKLFPSLGRNAPIPGRTPQTIAAYAKKIGVRRVKTLGDGISGPAWTDAEYAALRRHADRSGQELMSILPGRSEKAIRHARARLRQAP